MLSKIKVAFISIALAALAFGGFSVALAASSAPAGSAAASNSAALANGPAAVTPAAPTTTGVNWAMGVISALGTDNFTVAGPLGGTHVVYVNGQTLYFNRSAQPSNFAALQVGDRVFGAASIGSDGSAPAAATATLVIDLGVRSDYRGIGVASAVNSTDQSFTFVNRAGRVWDFYMDANTKITDQKGNAKTFADIHVGTRLAVHAQKRADGKWWAVEIKVGKTVAPAASTTASQS